MKSTDADVISQMPKAKSLAFSAVGIETKEVSHTARASTEESKNKVAIHEEYPFPVRKILQQIQNLEEPGQSSNCTEDESQHSIWSSETTKYGASMFYLRAA